MRVLMLSWEYPPIVYGGLGRHVHALSVALARAGHDVVVVTQAAAGAPAAETCQGVRVVRAEGGMLGLPLADLLPFVLSLNHGLARAALRATADWRPEIVHAHDWVVLEAAKTAKESLGAPLVATMHATEAGRHQGWLPGPLSRSVHGAEWWLSYESRRVITCSEHMRWEVSRLFELPPTKVDVVPGGVDPARWRPGPAATAAARGAHSGRHPLLVAAARLEYEKGLQDLLRALPRLRRRFPRLRLVVAGAGGHAEELRRQAAELRLGSAVRFTGVLDQAALAALFGAADCAVAPSRYEPFGLVALEAAAAGTPVVAADTGGLADIVEHQVTGLRFPAGDVPALAEAVGTVLGDEVLRRRLGRAGQRRAIEHFGWDRAAEHTVASYRRASRTSHAQQPPTSVSEGNLLARG